MYKLSFNWDGSLEFPPGIVCKCRLGLPTIRHPLSLSGGSMEIQPEQSEGTQIILTMPKHACD